MEAVGGSLTLVAQFPDKEPIAIAGLGDIAVTPETERLNVALLRRVRSRNAAASRGSLKRVHVLPRISHQIEFDLRAAAA